MNFALKLKKIRKKRGLSQTDLAKLAKVAPSSISQLESKTRKPSIDSLKKISKALNISVDYFLGLKETKLDIPDELIEIVNLLNDLTIEKLNYVKSFILSIKD